MKTHNTLAIVLATPLLLFLLVLHAHAQGPTNLASLTIKLWPEYDDPRLLVIIDGQLVEPGSQVRLPLPDDAQLNAVASSDGSGRLLKNNFSEEKTADGTRLLVMTPDNPLFRVEYYTPIPANGEERVIDFELPAGYFVSEQTAIEVLTPPGSKDVTLDPPTDESGPTQDEAHLFQRPAGPIKDQTVSQKVVYKNPGGALTVPENPSPSSGAAQSNTTSNSQEQPSAVGKQGVSPWLIGLAVAATLLIIGGAMGLRFTRESSSVPTAASTSSAARKKQRRQHKGAAATQRSLDKFCRKCGREFGPGDRFCRYCGEPRQKIS
ncbi:MAG: hypothetical protein DSY55_00435 [Clostridia bacterium]|nr:MAG: hypothetical protein DSY55_00435 [Clostridia bacterium]